MKKGRRTKFTINPTEYVTVASAAELLGIGRQAMYYRVKEGHLSVLEIDGVTFVHRREVLKLTVREKSQRNLGEQSNNMETVKSDSELDKREMNCLDWDDLGNQNVSLDVDKNDLELPY